MQLLIKAGADKEAKDDVSVRMKEIHVDGKEGVQRRMWKHC